MNSKIGKFCNCTKKAECPSPGDNYECCSEMVPGGSPARFGLWVENKTCDPSKGIPKDAHLEKEKYMPSHSHIRMAGPVEGYNRSNPRQAPEEGYYSPEGYYKKVQPQKPAQEGYYSPESYPQQAYPQQAYPQQAYPQRMSSVRSCQNKAQQMYPKKAYSSQPYSNKAYSKGGYYYEDEDEDEEEEEDEDPCGDLRNGFNILLWILVIGVIISGVYYLKSKKPKEK
jgi:hypothetical protein